MALLAMLHEVPSVTCGAVAAPTPAGVWQDQGVHPNAERPGCAVERGALGLWAQGSSRGGHWEKREAMEVTLQESAMDTVFWYNRTEGAITLPGWCTGLHGIC